MRAYKFILAAALITVPVAASADGLPGAVKSDETVYSHMIFSGGEVVKNSWESYTGTIIALNRDLSKEGVLIRFMGSYGRYEYDTTSSFDGRMWQGDAMIGYQWVRDRVDAGVYVGVDVINHKIKPFDPNNPVSGHETGFKVAADIETKSIEHNLPYYFALEGSYSTAFDTYYAIGRVGLNRNNVIFGVEGWVLGDETGNAQRLGGFVMWERNLRPDLLAEVTLSGGYQFVNDDDNKICGSFFGSEGAYANVNVAFKFGDRRYRPLK
jgi:cellulose biosynthesis protein BcsS